MVIIDFGCAQASASIPSAVRRCTPRPAIGGFADRSHIWRMWMIFVLEDAGNELRELIMCGGRRKRIVHKVASCVELNIEVE